MLEVRPDLPFPARFQRACRITICDSLRSYIIEMAQFIKTKNENRYFAVLVAAWGVNRCIKALFGVFSRPDTPTAVLGGETVEH